MSLLALMLLIVASVASARGASGIISDVNNMLRDTQSSSSAPSPLPLTLATTMPSSVELLRFVNDEESEASEDVELELLSNGAQVSRTQQQRDDSHVDQDKLQLSDQVRLLSKQLNALMTRRREDYELLEHNLRKSLRLTTDAASVDADVRSELDQLRCVT